MYRITAYTHKQASKLGVRVRRSKKAGKKIDVVKEGKVVASVGAVGYDDYPTYVLKEERGDVPKGTAEKKRRSYKARHSKYRKKVGTPSWYADQLLW